MPVTSEHHGHMLACAQSSMQSDIKTIGTSIRGMASRQNDDAAWATGRITMWDWPSGRMMMRDGLPGRLIMWNGLCVTIMMMGYQTSQFGQMGCLLEGPFTVEGWAIWQNDDAQWAVRQQSTPYLISLSLITTSNTWKPTSHWICVILTTLYVMDYYSENTSIYNLNVGVMCGAVVRKKVETYLHV